jgi:hypothetical protein
MKARLILACAVAGAAATVFSSTASADNAPTGGLHFSPNWGKPGDRIDVFGECSDPKFTVSPVVSEVLNAGDISGYDSDGTGHPNLNLHSFATVKPNAKPGEYRVSFKCGGKPISQTFRVVAPQTLPPASVSVSPRRGVPGTKVTVSVHCDRDPSSVSTTALSITGMNLVKEGLFEMRATVFDVKPGLYRIVVKCGAKDVLTSFTVLDPKSPAKNAQVPVKPKGAAETGDLPDA